jgi:acylphosphatase
MPGITGRHIKVTGSVQGVGYRYYCREAAAGLGLRGYVMNMPDGSVEIEIFGEQELVDSFLSSVTGRGMMFNIDNITQVEIPDNKRYNDFYIQRYPGY